MLKGRTCLSLALAIVAAACFERSSLLTNVIEPPIPDTTATGSAIHIVEHSPTAPPLTTYDTSFWVKRGTETNLAVPYQPAPGQTAGQAFLYFHVPKDGLIADAAGQRVSKGDSVQLTLSIDSTAFSVDFGPSGVQFSTKYAARLTMCYENMDPDLNADGVVDATDQALQQQLSVWYQAMEGGAWSQLPTSYDPANPCVSAPLHHFSQYSVSW